MIKVGSLGERWVLIQHSEPWLLTVNSKQRPQSHFKSDELPFLENQHNIPFMRKRCRRGVREETEEPPAKKLAVDRQESEDREDLDRSVGDNTTDTTTEDKLQKEQADQENGDTLMDVERGTQTQPEEQEEREEVQEKSETKESQGEKRQLRARKNSVDDERDETVSSPPTGSADQDDE